MNQPQTFAQSPMFVELSAAGIRHVFELGAADDRAFLVGSSRQTDLCIDRPGVAAVEFHLERAGNDVWLVPAYRERGLRVNGAPATSSMRLADRLSVCVGALELELRVLQNASEAGSSSRSSSAPRALPADYSETVPTDTANTSIAMKPFDAEPDAAMPTLVVPALRAVVAAVPDQQTQRIAALRPAPLQSLQHTQRLEPSALPRPRPSQAAPQVLFETQRLPPLTTPLFLAAAALESALVPSRVLPVLSEDATRSNGHSPLTTQETSAFDVAALKMAVAQPTTFLTQLGVATRQRPVLILGGGLAASLVLALALVGGSRLAKPAGRVSTTDAVASALVVGTASAPPNKPHAPTATSTPSIVAVPPPADDTKPAGRGPRKVADPELTNVVGQVSAGRLSEASRTYASLSSRPEGAVVYAKAAAILARRADQSCSANSASAPVDCPEVIK